MKKKYTIILTPTTCNKQIINLSRSIPIIADSYLLGEHSLPHVTLCVFIAEEAEINEIGYKACKTIEENVFSIEFKEISCTTSNGHLFWVSLLPDHCDVLHKMHRIISSALDIPIKKTFNPHMTLLNTKDAGYEVITRKALDTCLPITDIFELSLGLSDEVGQLTEINYNFLYK